MCSLTVVWSHSGVDISSVITKRQYWNEYAFCCNICHANHLDHIMHLTLLSVSTDTSFKFIIQFRYIGKAEYHLTLFLDRWWPVVSARSLDCNVIARNPFQKQLMSSNSEWLKYMWCTEVAWKWFLKYLISMGYWSTCLFCFTVFRARSSHYICIMGIGMAWMVPYCQKI